VRRCWGRLRPNGHARPVLVPGRAPLGFPPKSRHDRSKRRYEGTESWLTKQVKNQGGMQTSGGSAGKRKN
jgi:hypothetical protein